MLYAILCYNDEDAVFSTQQLLVIKGLIADAIKAATSPALGAGIH